MAFNKEQKAAINFKDGALIVVAGPGSGKTTVVINRTAKLIKSGVDPEKILVITFTKAAAKEMQLRFHALMEEDLPPVTFGTIHSIALKILVNSFGYQYENVISDKEQWTIIKKIIKDLGVYTDDITSLVKHLLSSISYVKSNKLSKEDYESLDCGCRSSVFDKIYSKYAEYCKDNNKIDYDDMQTLCVELLKKDKDELKYWRNVYQYIMVDEAQDMDVVQAELVYLLVKPLNNICIVGDDDQSLYRFRGAKPEIMLKFEKDFSAQKIVLDTNYRSGKGIVDATSAFIKTNNNRFNKDFKSVRGRGKINIGYYSDAVLQSKKIISDIKKMIRNGAEYDDLAILYRTNAESSKIVSELIKMDIPFVAKSENVINLFEHWIFKDIVNFYELAKNPKHMDINKAKRALKRPTRFISNDVLKSSKSLDDIIDWGYKYHKPYIARNIYDFKTDIKTLSKLKLNNFLNYLVETMDYRKSVMDYADYNQMDPQELINVLDEILDSAKEFDDFELWYEYAKDYTITLSSNADAEKSGVRLLTFHSCKGLEFKKVYIINANETITPYAHKGVVNDIEEERRMFYVAMTRAKDYADISYISFGRNGKKLEPSRFVIELNDILS